MADLFDMPLTRGNKGAVNNVLKQAKNIQTAPVSIKSGNMFAKISSIKALVEQKLGKYRDDYLCYMQDQEELFKEYIYNVKQTGVCAFDTETTGLNPLKDNIVGFSLYSKGQKPLYIPIHHRSYITMAEIEGQLPIKFLAEQMKLLVDAGTKFEMANAPFDIRVAKKHMGIYIPCWFDVQLAGNCLNENESHRLKDMHSKYVLNGEEDEWSFGKLFDDITFDLVPIDSAYIYGAHDAIITDELTDFQLPFLTPENELCKEYDLQDVSKVFWNIEMPYVDVIVELEDNGVAIDQQYASELAEKYHALETEKLDNFYELLKQYQPQIDDYILKHPNNKLSDPINIASPTQLAILFYDILQIPVVDKEHPRGTGEEILSKVDNPLCKAITDYRGVAKLLSTYIDAIPQTVLDDNRVHCNFKQYGAKTGRLSSTDPNLQNIPSHNKDIRKMFVPSEGNVMLSSDFSQQEPRCMAAMCGDPIMLQAYRDDKDLYASIASLAFNKSYEDCLEFYLDENGHKTEKVNKEGKERRSSAKSILLGILYGRGLNSVAEQLHTTKEKAQQIQDKIFKGFPAIKKFEDDTVQMAKDVGFVTTFWGRKRRLPDMQKDEFEFKWKEGHGDIDPLSFSGETVETEVPDNIVRKYLTKLKRAWGSKRREVVDEAKKEGIIITDNGGKIADATRQCVNSRIQGSAADMSKIAGRIIYDNKRLRELGFKLLIPIHDEYLAECPKENVKECSKLFSECMCKAAEDLGIPIKCDVAITDRWYGSDFEFENPEET